MYFTCLIMQDLCTRTFCIVCFALIEKRNVFRINFPLSIPLFIYFRNNRMLLYLLLVRGSCLPLYSALYVPLTRDRPWSGWM